MWHEIKLKPIPNIKEKKGYFCGIAFVSSGIELARFQIIEDLI